MTQVTPTYGGLSPRKPGSVFWISSSGKSSLGGFPVESRGAQRLTLLAVDRLPVGRHKARVEAFDAFARELSAAGRGFVQPAEAVSRHLQVPVAPGSPERSFCETTTQQGSLESSK